MTPEKARGCISGLREWSHREPAFVEGDNSTVMITVDVPSGLYGTGVFEDTVSDGV